MMTGWYKDIDFQAMPVWLQISIIIVSSFITEDATLIATSLLYRSQEIIPFVYWFGSIVGILVGDLILYGAGYWYSGKRNKIMGIDITSLHIHKERSKWEMFTVVAFSQFIPGSRLPLYLACGVIHYPLGLFVIAKILILPIWVYLFSLFGDVLLDALKMNAVYALLAFVAIFLLYRTIKHYHKNNAGIPLIYRLRALPYRLIRYRYYEFWPAWLFYIPFALYIHLHAIRRYRYRLSITTLANPAMRYGGIIGESKAESYRLIPDGHEAKLALSLIEGRWAIEEKLNALAVFMQQKQLAYPIIIKPDNGLRGVGVKRIYTELDAQEYLERADYDVVAQELSSYKCEAGVFYISYPDNKASEIFSITDKEFPSLMGDGASSLAELILQDKRARLIANTYFVKHKEQLSWVPAKGESITLVNIGNHAQGAVFHDGMEKLYTETLHKVFDCLSHEMEGFYIGRFDVRYQDADSLRKGENYHIVEVNGAGSEATHIYNSNVTLWEAYKTLFTQIRYVYAIGSMEYAKGARPESAWSIFIAWIRYIKQSSRYVVAS